MKNLISILMAISVLLLTNACSKESEPIIVPDPSEFSFTYNGKDYHNLDNVGVSRQGIIHIYLNRIDVFGGNIYFDIHKCAYLTPEFTDCFVDQNCTLISRPSYQITPIDSSIFLYQSGSCNVGLSKCKTYTGDGSIGSITFTSCTASGTFDLRLVNQNNKTIEITNGIINNFPVYY